MSPVQAEKGGSVSGTGEDWSKHPIYIALSSRLAATESAISSLSAQVNILQDIVNRSLPIALSSTSIKLDADKPESIAALTQQISALSTSVAQLQRLQSVSQTQSLRQSARDTLPALGLGSLSLHNQNVFNTGPLTAPHSGAGPFKQQRDFHPPPQQGQGQGQGRPQNPRSISTNMVPPAPAGLDGDKTWGPPTRGGGNPLSPGGGGWPTSVMNGGGNNPTTPGGMMTPSIAGQGNGNGNGNGNGAGVPGAGIVVTKWDHLNLKPELVRSIQKYG
jgi:hypothetical protein